MSQVWEKLRQSLLLKLKPKSGDYVRIVGLKDKFAGVWLNGKFTHPFFRLHDPHMCMAIRLRLGLEPAEGLVFCRCGAPLKTDPLHFLSCKKLSAERTFRHARLTTLISKFANIANIPVRLEPRVGCVRNRADAVVAFASCETLVDVSVVHASAPSICPKVTRPLSAAAWREKEKFKHYEQDAIAEGKKFYPVVIETTGALGSGLKSFFVSLSQNYLISRLVLLLDRIPSLSSFAPSLHYYNNVMPVLPYMALERPGAFLLLSSSDGTLEGDRLSGPISFVRIVVPPVVLKRSYIFVCLCFPCSLMPYYGRFPPLL